jgi:abequosyltransferase
MTDSPPLLSICIPSYNRAPLLGELLERLAQELTGDLADLVEVVVSDNASPDATPATVAHYAPRIRRFVSIRQSENIGSDRNFLAVVAAASGRYACLMGDDDMPEPGGVARIIEVLRAHPEIAGLTVDRYARSFDLKTRRSEDALGHFPRTEMLVGADAVFTRLTEYIAFMSAQVFDRALWMKVVRTKPVEDFFNAYIHMYVFAEMLQRNPRWLVLKERLVTWRADNDSFLSAGRYRRMEIDVVGYEQIARACFGEHSETYAAIRDTVAAKNFRMHITAARMEGVWDREMQARTRRLAMKYYARSPKFWIVAAPFLFMPAGLLPVLKFAQKVVHGRRARRIGMVSGQAR